MKPFFLSVLAATAALAQGMDDEAALVDLERQWNQALKTHDAAWLEKNFAHDMTDVSSGNGALHSKAEDIAMMKADKTVYETLELSELKARVEGNTGIVTGVIISRAGTNKASLSRSASRLPIPTLSAKAVGSSGRRSTRE
ncbi:MAG TPA: nuclear transport factor 2 family protein [Chthoniobacterales bacterium]|nr:nuclear transport factor 2 family protein [Chthoniobacterales bacterium]